MGETLTKINARRSEYVTKKLLKVAEYRDVYGMIGAPPMPRKDKLPMHESKTIQWRRVEHLPKKLTPLLEGVTPDSSVLTVTDLTEAMGFFGDYVVLTDLSIETVEDPLLAITADRQSEQAIRSLTELREGVLLAGTSVAYANGTARNQVNTLITATLIAKVERSLDNAYARKLTRLLSATQGYNTTPIPESYVGICSSWVGFDMRVTIGEANGFTPVEKYSQTTKLLPNEIGKISQTRFSQHPEMTYFPDAGTTKGTGHKSTSGTLEDIFATLIFGEEGFGLAQFGGYGGKDGVQGIVKSLGSGGTEDPLNQRATSGWKTGTATKRLNESWMWRIESGATG